MRGGTWSDPTASTRGALPFAELLGRPRACPLITWQISRTGPRGRTATTCIPPRGAHVTSLPDTWLDLVELRQVHLVFFPSMLFLQPLKTRDTTATTTVGARTVGHSVEYSTRRATSSFESTKNTEIDNAKDKAVVLGNMRLKLTSDRFLKFRAVIIVHGQMLGVIIKKKFRKTIENFRIRVGPWKPRWNGSDVSRLRKEGIDNSMQAHVKPMLGTKMSGNYKGLMLIREPRYHHCSLRSESGDANRSENTRKREFEDGFRNFPGNFLWSRYDVSKWSGWCVQRTCVARWRACAGVGVWWMHAFECGAVWLEIWSRGALLAKVSLAKVVPIALLHGGTCRLSKQALTAPPLPQKAAIAHRSLSWSHLLLLQLQVHLPFQAIQESCEKRPRENRENQIRWGNSYPLLLWRSRRVFFVLEGLGRGPSR